MPFKGNLKDYWEVNPTKPDNAIGRTESEANNNRNRPGNNNNGPVDRDTFPKGSKVSTTSNDKNDPLIDFPSINELAISTEVQIRPKFMLDYSQFVTIVDTGYDIISKNRMFSMSVSLSISLTSLF